MKNVVITLVVIIVLILLGVIPGGLGEIGELGGRGLGGPQNPLQLPNVDVPVAVDGAYDGLTSGPALAAEFIWPDKGYGIYIEGDAPTRYLALYWLAIILQAFIILKLLRRG